MQTDAASARWWHPNRICAPETPKADSSASSWRKYAHTAARFFLYVTIQRLALAYSHLNPYGRVTLIWICLSMPLFFPPNPPRDCTSQVHVPYFSASAYITWTTAAEWLHVKDKRALHLSPQSWSSPCRNKLFRPIVNIFVYYQSLRISLLLLFLSESFNHEIYFVRFFFLFFSQRSCSPQNQKDSPPPFP